MNSNFLSNPPIDVTIVASRRPQLVEKTLLSFKKNVFDSMNIGNVYANVDPIFGDTHDGKIVVNLLEKYFDNITIFQPDYCGFCEAVMRVWSNTTNPLIFHLEDDWVSLAPIDSNCLIRLFEGSVRQVSLMSENKNWNTGRRGNFHYKPSNRLVRLFDRVNPFLSPQFTTSPSMLDGNFARSCAGLMDQKFDPEKQFSRVNPVLWKYVCQYQNRLYEDPEIGTIIKDTGRQWLYEHNIIKIIKNHQSHWITGKEDRNRLP